MCCLLLHVQEQAQVVYRRLLLGVLCLSHMGHKRLLAAGWIEACGASGEPSLDAMHNFLCARAGQVRALAQLPTNSSVEAIIVETVGGAENTPQLPLGHRWEARSRREVGARARVRACVYMCVVCFLSAATQAPTAPASARVLAAMRGHLQPSGPCVRRAAVGRGADVGRHRACAAGALQFPQRLGGTEQVCGTMGGTEQVCGTMGGTEQVCGTMGGTQQVCGTMGGTEQVCGTMGGTEQVCGTMGGTEQVCGTMGGEGKDLNTWVGADFVHPTYGCAKQVHKTWSTALLSKICTTVSSIWEAWRRAFLFKRTGQRAAYLWPCLRNVADPSCILGVPSCTAAGPSCMLGVPYKKQ